MCKNLFLSNLIYLQRIFPVNTLVSLRVIYVFLYYLFKLIKRSVLILFFKSYPFNSSYKSILVLFNWSRLIWELKELVISNAVKVISFIE